MIVRYKNCQPFLFNLNFENYQTDRIQIFEMYLKNLILITCVIISTSKYIL